MRTWAHDVATAYLLMQPLSTNLHSLDAIMQDLAWSSTLTPSCQSLRCRQAYSPRPATAMNELSQFHPPRHLTVVTRAQLRSWNMRGCKQAKPSCLVSGPYLFTHGTPARTRLPRASVTGPRLAADPGPWSSHPQDGIWGALVLTRQPCAGHVVAQQPASRAATVGWASHVLAASDVEVETRSNVEASEKQVIAFSACQARVGCGRNCCNLGVATLLHACNSGLPLVYLWTTPRAFLDHL